MTADVWRHYTVVDIAAPLRNAIVGGPFGSDLVSRDYVSQGVPVIRGANMGRGRWVSGEFVYVTPEKADSLSSNCAKPGDLIFTQRGTLGQVALVPIGGPERYLISQSQMKLTVDPEKVDRLFMYYVFTSEEQQEYIRNSAIQTGVPHTNLGILKKTPIRIPALDKQREIAKTLGALDDKIELLQRMNVTLEVMAAAIFKSWFIDFDPVRAKSEGREPQGMSADIAALFPSEFVDSELGPIPKGWSLRAVGEIADVVKGKSYSSKDLVSGGSTALVTLKSFERGGGFRMDGFKPYAGLYKPTQVVRAGDVVLAFTDVTQAAELIGRPAIVVDVDEYETLVASLDVGIIRPALEGVSKEYIFGLLQSEAFLAHALAHTTGTTVLHLSKEAVPSFMAAIPPDPLVAAYSSIAAAIRSKVQSNIDMGRSLRDLRDLVLPALISGRISPLPVTGMEAEVYGG